MEGIENKFKLNNCVYFIHHDEDGFTVQQGYISKIKLDEDGSNIIYEIREDRYDNCSDRPENEIFSSYEEAKTYISNNVLKKWTKYRLYDY